VTEEQKQFISEQYLKHGKNAAETIPLFEEKYGFSPSTRVINKWKYFNEPDETDETPAEQPDGTLEAESNDTRTVKDDIDISGDEIPDDVFNKMCRDSGHSQEKMWKIISKAKQRGYTSVNLSTGEFKK